MKKPKNRPVKKSRDYYFWKRMYESRHQEVADLNRAYEGVREDYERLKSAVRNLPVEEWVEPDSYGDPELIGYVMQAQGEWDVVRVLLEEREQLTSGTEEQQVARLHRDGFI